jgi:hypothetical protein
MHAYSSQYSFFIACKIFEKSRGKVMAILAAKLAANTWIYLRQ